MQGDEKTTKRRGPAPKPQGEKAEQLTIRLTPKLKAGLDLLVRAQRGRSLSQVVEWALQRALNSVEVGARNGAISVAQMLDLAWEAPNDWQRILLFEDMAPELLDFGEKAVIETVRECAELREFRKEAELEAREASTDPNERSELQIALNERIEAAFDELVELHWRHLCEEVIVREARGETTRGVRLFSVLGLDERPSTLKELEKLLRLAADKST